VNPRDHEIDEDVGVLPARLIRAVWPSENQGIAPLANAMLSRFDQDAFYLSFGQVQPPNTFDKSAEEIATISTLPVVVVAQVALTPRRMKELIAVLQSNYERWETQVGGTGEGESSERDE